MDERHFNALTPKEAELLALLMEECGECVQACAKILRHGMRSEHPVTNEPNRVALEREMGDVHAAMMLMFTAKIVDRDFVRAFSDDKLRRVVKFLHHQCTA